MDAASLLSTFPQFRRCLAEVYSGGWGKLVRLLKAQSKRQEGVNINVQLKETLQEAEAQAQKELGISL
jgi:hypothetical protein